MVDKVVERIRLENLMRGLSKGEIGDIHSLLSSFDSFLKGNKVSFETNALLVFLFKNGYIKKK